MLKLIIFLCSVWFSLPLSSQTLPISKYITLDEAEFVGSYSLKYIEDSLNPDRIRQQDMLLFLGKNISLFVSKNHYIDFEAMRKHKTLAQREEWEANRGKYVPRSLYRIFKNYPKGKLTFTEITVAGTFIFEESLDLFNWELTNDTTTIAGYKAQKATCDFGGRSWVAWFSPEIPFNDGPYKFNGLPGLIVKVCDTRNHYVFELLTIEKPAPGLLIEIKDYPYIKTTKEKFFRAKDYSREDIIRRVKETGGGIESQQKAANVMARQNNPIELKQK